MNSKDKAEYKRLMIERRKECERERQEFLAAAKAREEESVLIDKQLRLLDERTSFATPLVQLPYTARVFDISRLKGMSQPEAVIAIAKFQNGIVKTDDLIQILQTAGLMRKTRNAGNIAYRLLNNSDRFERIATGCYRLKSSMITANTEEDSSNSQAHFITTKQIQ
jgi:hypothetical protein